VTIVSATSFAKPILEVDIEANSFIAYSNLTDQVGIYQAKLIGTLTDQPATVNEVGFTFAVSACEVTAVVVKDSVIEAKYTMDSGPLTIRTSQYIQTPACNLKPFIVAVTPLNLTDVQLNFTGTKLVIKQNYSSILEQQTLMWNIQMQFGSLVNSDGFVAVRFAKPTTQTTPTSLQLAVLPCFGSEAAAAWSYSFPAPNSEVKSLFKCSRETCFRTSIVDRAFTLSYGPECSK
jgi:hypothetical protein